MKKPTRHIFISPHLDDAVLSAGDLIAGLLKDGEKVRIITVFTDFGAGPMHLCARRYVFESGALTVRSFKRLRLIEDRRVMEKLGVGDYYYLDFTDAYFRLRSAGVKFGKLHTAAAWLGIKSCFLYPNLTALFSGRINQEDDKLLPVISEKLKQLLLPEDTVYGPLGVGNHIDHTIVNRVIRRLKIPAKFFWLDLPYAFKLEFAGNLNLIKREYRLKFRSKTTVLKLQALKLYTSQLSCVETLKVKPREEFYEIAS